MSCVYISSHYEVVTTLQNILIHVKKWGVSRNTMTCHMHNVLFKGNGSTPYFLLKKAQLQTLKKIKFIVEFWSYQLFPGSDFEMSFGKSF